MSERYDALISYTRFDDEHDGAYLTAFREQLSGEVRAQSGQEFRIFQDTEDIKWGDQFGERIDHALDTITFFIPILTPSFFNSEFCRYELEKFLAREQQLGRNNLVLPVYYIRVKGLESAALRANDPLMQTLAARQRIDWRKLRRRWFDLPEVNDTLFEMAEHIADALDALPPPAPAEQQRREAEAAEQKRREAEAAEQKRREAEAAEQKRREAEAAERKRREAEAAEQKRREAEAAEQKRREAEAAERKRREAEAAERKRREAEAAERKRREAEAAEQKRRDPIVKLPGGATLELIQIPEGVFLMGSSDNDPDADRDEKPQHRLHLPTYYIGKTPVTNAQFRPFLEGDGYTNRAYWSDNGWEWRTKLKRTQPYHWNDKKWNGAAQPVVGVSWYEAAAYCRWLSAQTGDNYCLPSEAEWEKAARGTDGRIYPWGNQAPDKTRANFGKAVGRTTPVGIYPAGASPYGVLDMAENVWEWTRSEYQDYPYNPDDGREEGSDPAGKVFTLRGGSWYTDRTYVRCAARYWYDPYYGVDVISGFRVLLSPRVQ
jgi:formylglycine-generating enzyme required for sulfatase activity